MSKPIPTKLFLPKQLFSSLTDWVKANYTSWGWKNASVSSKGWTINDGITMTQVDSSTFSFRGADKWGSCGVGRTESLITGVHAMAKCPKTTPFIKVLIGTTDIQQAHSNIYPTFSDSAYNYFVIDTDEGFSRFYPNEGTTDWMDVRFFDPYIVLKSHLKPIAVGDKLGLVYWDGTECVDAGESMFVASKDYNVLAASYSPPNYGYGLKLLKNDTGERTEPFLLKAGTVNLSAYDATITGIETTGETLLKDHLWHVI